MGTSQVCPVLLVWERQDSGLALFLVEVDQPLAMDQPWCFSVFCHLLLTYDLAHNFPTSLTIVMRLLGQLPHGPCVGLLQSPKEAQEEVIINYYVMATTARAPCKTLTHFYLLLDVIHDNFGAVNDGDDFFKWQQCVEKICHMLPLSLHACCLLTDMSQQSLIWKLRFRTIHTNSQNLEIPAITRVISI